MQPTAGGPFGWQFEHAMLRQSWCVDGWLKFALVHARDGEWHWEHVVPKWLAGALWQLEHAEELGWVNAHDLPGRLWHE